MHQDAVCEPDTYKPEPGKKPTPGSREFGDICSKDESAIVLAVRCAAAIRAKQQPSAAREREDAVTLVKTLLEKGADPNFMNTEVFTHGSWGDETNHTPPLNMAGQHSDNEVEALLLEQGANDGIPCIGDRCLALSKGKDGETKLHPGKIRKIHYLNQKL